MIISATITKSVGGLFTIRTDELYEGKREYDVRAKGSFKHDKITLLAGDRVDVEIDEHGEFFIKKIHTRKNSLIRPPLANIDIIFVVISCKKPAPVYETIDKMIAIAEYNKIEPVIVITKCELDEARAAELESLYRSCGFECFKLSAKDDIGVEPIDEFIKQNMAGKTAAFAGASGIGKSTLLNRLFPHLELSTSDISRKIERGRHTTREAVLFAISDAADCGYIADTPGFSMLDFKRFDFFEKDDLVHTMREFESYIGQCKYTKCSHTKEQGCAVIEAVKSGAIPKSRHESYVELYDILKTRKKWE